MPELPKTNASLKSYAVLRRVVEETLLVGQQRIEALKVQTYWRTGASINEHVRLNGARAEYGKKVLLTLGRDLDLDESVLGRCSRFHEKFPHLKIQATWPELPANPRQIEKNASGKPLSWSHFRILITIENDRVRNRLAERAAHGNWTVERLEEEAWKFKTGRALTNSSGNGRKNLLTPRLGRLNTSRLVAPSKIHWPAKSGLMFDRGFKSYDWLAPDKVRGFSADEIIEVRKSRLAKSKRTERDLFTYLAYVDYVIDGDSVPRKTAQEMRVGPSKSIYGNGFQSALSGVG
ncbi:MAG: hypothetical protein HYZ83_05835 [Candidatus Omnitrophica bacterium]|nr:hypothetical protein [Candidatus Omnitrophota bacterium]